MSDDRGPLSCQAADELAGLYVLDALEPDEHEAVRQHLATCSHPHDEFAAVASVVPAMATVFEPIDAPSELKGRVLDAIAEDARQTRSSASPSPKAIADAWRGTESRSETSSVPAVGATRRGPILGWTLTAAAVILIAVLGAWNVVLQGQVGDADRRARLVSQAVAARNSSGAEVATLTGSGPATGATGFAAFPSQGSGYLFIVGLPEAPAGRTYQAWYLVDGQASSAGLMEVAPDGTSVLAIAPHAGTDTIALTVEPAGGVVSPTGTPILAGDLST